MTGFVAGVASVGSMGSSVGRLASVLEAVSWGAGGRRGSMPVCVPCVSVASGGVAWGEQVVLGAGGQGCCCSWRTMVAWPGDSIFGFDGLGPGW